MAQDIPSFWCDLGFWSTEVLHERFQRWSAALFDIAIMIAWDGKDGCIVPLIWLIELGIILIGLSIVVGHIAQMIKEGWFVPLLVLLQIFFHILSNKVLGFP